MPQMILATVVGRSISVGSLLLSLVGMDSVVVFAFFVLAKVDFDFFDILPGQDVGIEDGVFYIQCRCHNLASYRVVLANS